MRLQLGENPFAKATGTFVPCERKCLENVRERDSADESASLCRATVYEGSACCRFRGAGIPVRHLRQKRSGNSGQNVATSSCCKRGRS
jgi:hypothetical protein